MIDCGTICHHNLLLQDPTAVWEPPSSDSIMGGMEQRHSRISSIINRVKAATIVTSGFIGIIIQFREQKVTFSVVVAGVRSNTWQHYDYGVEWRNAMAYDGRPFPPAYNPGDIPATLPVFVVLGERDACAPAAGVRLFLSLLKGHPTSLSLPNYAHYDLTYSVNRTQDIFNPILDFLSSSDDIY